MSVRVSDNVDRRRYEVFEDDALAGFFDYALVGTELSLTHTEVDPAFGGRGLGGQLAAGALEDARARGLAVLPVCPLVQRIISRNAEEYRSLVPHDRWSAFDLSD